MDVALKRIEEENNLLNIDLSDLKQAKGETEKVESSAQDDSSDKKEAGETVEMKVDDGIMEQADLGESKETPEETVEVTLDGESTEVVSKVEESVEVEDVDLSETVEDTVQVIDKEPGECTGLENRHAHWASGGQIPPPPLVKNNYTGEVAEWLKAHAWKACLHSRVTWVRIPPSPQL